MKEIESIRKVYKPIQPSVKVGHGNVRYEEFAVDAHLENYIHCYWQLATCEVLKEPYEYRVVSDGCIDVFFNLDNTSEAFVMGFCRKYTEFSIGTNFNYFGIRFYPSIFPLLFGVQAKSLSDKDQPLKNILPQFHEFIVSKIGKNALNNIQSLDDFFVSLVRNLKLDIDDRFYNALLLICKKNGHVETESDLNTGLSSRQLRRLFDYYIGTTPKLFSQVIRFQYILNAKPSSQSLKENKLYYDVGFCDQAHFIKSFKKFYGVTPAKAFR